MSAAVSIRDLSFAYEKDPVISHLDLTLPAGTITAVLGANGVGKTTLLHLLLGLFEPDSGEIHFFDRPIHNYSQIRRKQLIGMVSQNDTPPFDLRVDEYVLLGRAPHLGLLTIPGDPDRAAAGTALSTVGMTHMAGHTVTRLSSGEKQLVNTARSLAQEPEILLLDEPCSHLDLINSRQMLILMETIAKKGKTVVFTTHDPNAAAAVADQVLLMKKGKLVAAGTVAQTLTRGLLTRTYGGDVEVIETEKGPFVRAV
ncbi:MAG: ABC transporter ATP-binding protein [Desulfotignum sp.]|nr:ABC transporter ATP-binding protein [Desulfotignum sp.]MCF8137150.1 ABC transporter ATP-binding protein [Desulfotignum sp.]